MRRRITDDEGSMGVGALIVFIAMILLSSIILATMILIAEKLAQTPQNTGLQSLRSTADKIIINEMYVRDGFDNYGIVFQLTPASGTYSADELYWVLQCTDENDLFHNYGGDFTGSSFDTTNPHTFANESQQNGILARYYDFGSALSVMPDVALRAPDFINHPTQIAFTSVGTGVTWPGIPYHEQYAAIYTGYIDIPTDGDYTFRLTSDDGSIMYLDGEIIISNDGTHPMTEVSSGGITLKAGFHSFQVDYFENAVNNGLELRWASAAIAGQLIPAANFYRSIGPVAGITTYEPGIIYELSLDQNIGGDVNCGPEHLFQNGIEGKIRFFVGGGGYTYEEFYVRNNQPGTRII
jgi:archaellin